MRPFGALISFEEAYQIVMSYVKPVDRLELVEIGQSLHRVLSQDVHALMDTPPFTRAAADGYALRAEDTFGTSLQSPRSFKVTGAAYAGESPSQMVTPGTCIQVSTGARLPEGANAVVMTEEADISYEGQIIISRPVYPGANIAQRGEDILQGDLLLPQGAVLTPARIGALASQGINELEVYMKPKVAIVPTGNEVRLAGSHLGPNDIYDINSYTLTALVNENGGSPSRFNVVGDSEEELASFIEEASSSSDLVVISGGSSVGERDLLVKVIDSMGEMIFHGIQIKPGKPTLFGLVQGKPLLGMPGYPTSCLINAYILLMPALRKMAHLAPRKPLQVQTVLARRVTGSVGRKQFLPVKLEGGKAIPILKASGTITGLAQADGYAVIPENVDVVEPDTPILVTLFPDY